MSQSLDDFVTEVRVSIDMFQMYWRSENKKDPENFPLEIGENNKGVWWEFFMYFNENQDE